ncbi:MAG: phage capsid protein [Alphaproteobacteria bacterium]|nr:phage capsid protein [Alphaproteobacteria bacterium]
MSNNQPFPSDPELTAISIAYRNPDQALISDLAVPRVSPIGKSQYKYYEFPLAQGFTIPETLVGRRSQPNEINFSAEEKDGSTKDHALDSSIPQDDIDDARAGGGKIDPVKNAVETVTDLVTLARESRVAKMVFNTNYYPAANKVALVGTARLNDFANSDPVTVFQTAVSTPIGARPNVAVFGGAVWDKVRVHPKIVAHCYGAASTRGYVSKEDLAAAFELDEILVGKARYNTANRGQAASLGYIWGKSISFMYRDRSATNGNGKVTFALQIPRGTRQAGVQADGDIGARGGQRVRVWESQSEHVVCPDAGYLISTAID